MGKINLDVLSNPLIYNVYKLTMFPSYGILQVNGIEILKYKILTTHPQYYHKIN